MTLVWGLWQRGVHTFSIISVNMFSWEGAAASLNLVLVRPVARVSTMCPLKYRSFNCTELLCCAYGICASSSAHQCERFQAGNSSLCNSNPLVFASCIDCLLQPSLYCLKMKASTLTWLSKTFHFFCFLVQIIYCIVILTCFGLLAWYVCTCCPFFNNNFFSSIKSSGLMFHNSRKVCILDCIQANVVSSNFTDCSYILFVCPGLLHILHL